jgi:hypothetical protein
MSLTSTSTIAEIQAAYVDNALFDVDNSLTQARLFVQACRILLLKMPKMAAQDRASLQLNPEMIQAEMERGVAFIANNPSATGGGGGGNRHFSFENLRDGGGWT